MTRLRRLRRRLGPSAKTAIRRVAGFTAFAVAVGFAPGGGRYGPRGLGPPPRMAGEDSGMGLWHLWPPPPTGVITPSILKCSFLPYTYTSHTAGGGERRWVRPKEPDPAPVSSRPRARGLPLSAARWLRSSRRHPGGSVKGDRGGASAIPLASGPGGRSTPRPRSGAAHRAAVGTVPSGEPVLPRAGLGIMHTIRILDYWFYRARESALTREGHPT